VLTEKTYSFYKLSQLANGLVLAVVVIYNLWKAQTTIFKCMYFF